MADFNEFFPGEITYSFGLVTQGITEGWDRDRIARAKLARRTLNDIPNGVRGLQATWTEGSTPEGALAMVEDLVLSINRLRPFFKAVEEEKPIPIDRDTALELCRAAREKAKELRGIA